MDQLVMTSDSEYKPKLRHVEPTPVIVNGREAVGLRDPLQLTDGIVCVEEGMLPVLALLDGRHSVLDIQVMLMRMMGRLVMSDEIRGLLAGLDKACLLEGETAKAAYKRRVEEYRQSPYRRAAHAGTSYSADPAVLVPELESYFQGPAGPGLPQPGSDPRRPVGLIAPHIDIRAGGRCFARGYHALASGVPSDVYVIFGTGHMGVEGLFATTNLDFVTPLGRIETDRRFIEELGEALGHDPAEEEILHKSEHVIEFQVLFLQHVLQGRHPFVIVPVLCSLSHLYFGDGQAFKSQHETFERFCGAMRDVCSQGSRSVCFVASADLDHIGPRYGDSFIPGRHTVNTALERDRRLLSCLERVDLEGFIKEVAADNDSGRICGFSPITAMLRCMDANAGHVLDLDYARVDDKNSFVSFTSVIFY